MDIDGKAMDIDGKAMDLFDYLLKRIISGEIGDKNALQRYKIEGCRKFSAEKLPSNAEVLEVARERIGDEKELDKVTNILRRKRTRTISGVAPVAVMTSPARCPHGKCICCPGGVERNTPQSYTGHEPAALRAIRCDYDPYRQTVDRIDQLHAIGHNTSKISLIVMGGTFPARDPEYQDWFVKRCFDGMNEPVALRANNGSGTRESDSLVIAQTENERASHRCVELTVETRPDHCFEEHVDKMLCQGATRVELGVQNVNDRALRAIERGHTVADTVRATRILKDRGLKVCYHVMPGLPGETPERDVRMFKTLFTDPDFKPDMLKIYPVLVVEGTGLFEMWKKGEYEPYSLEKMTEAVANMKALVPGYVRIQRVQRDIPAKMIDGGIRHSNLRQIVRRHMAEKGMECGCIRCREWGHKSEPDAELNGGEVVLRVKEYEASRGRELFIGAEERGKDLLCGYLRLRFPSGAEEEKRKELKGGRVGIVRELKVVGRAVKIGGRDEEAVQHAGIGGRLLKRAEEIAVERGMESMFVTSGVGAREYYRDRGYERFGPYMAKEIGGRRVAPIPQVR